MVATVTMAVIGLALGAVALLGPVDEPDGARRRGSSHRLTSPTADGGKRGRASVRSVRE